VGLGGGKEIKAEGGSKGGWQSVKHRERRILMPDSQDRLSVLEEQVADLQARLTALENQLSSRGQEGAASAFPFAQMISDREPHHPQTGTGSPYHFGKNIR